MYPACIEDSKSGNLEYFGEFESAREFLGFDKLVSYMMMSKDWCMRNGMGFANPDTRTAILAAYRHYKDAEDGSILRKLAESLLQSQE